MIRKINIAIIEDNEIHRMVLNAYLFAKDNVIFSNVDESVDLEYLLCYDIVLVDRILTTRDGEEIVDNLIAKGCNAILYSSGCIPVDCECIVKSDFAAIDREIEQVIENHYNIN
jgi:hypothetical protein